MYGTTVGGHFGTSVGNGAFSTCPRPTANRNKPFSAAYLKCHVLVIGPVPARNLATGLSRIRPTGVRGPTARQKDRRVFSVMMHFSPSVRRKATYCVTRSLMVIAGPPG